MRSINRLNEELSRWAFEILFKTNKEWKIAFTNPTAGPWKTIKAKSLVNGNVGEVYRFILEEDRPDIIMYNDKLEAIIIFEAKDSLLKLADKGQAKKSADVVIKLGEILHNKGDNSFWSGRENYMVILGLLWGSTETRENSSAKESLYDNYQLLIKGSKFVNDSIIIGVETLYKDKSLKCFTDFKCYEPKNIKIAKSICCSLI